MKEDEPNLKSHAVRIRLVTSSQKQRMYSEWWRHHFREALNRAYGSNANPEEEEQALTQMTQSLPMRMRLRKLRNNKAPGIDGIQPELLKYRGDELRKELYNMTVMIWEQEWIPEDWAKAIICSIHKKGDQSDSGNYQGIALLSCKILLSVLFEQLSPFAERQLGNYQPGFRRGRSTIYQHFSLRMTLERCKEQQITTHQLFVDFKAAYDSMDQMELYQIFEEMGIPKKLMQLVKMTTRYSKLVVLE